MKKHKHNLGLRFVNFVSKILLDNPFMYNHVRYFLAGKQTGMKKFIGKYLRKYKCKTIGDICCGTGDFAEIIPKNSKYWGWDLNPDFINFCKKRYEGKKNVKFFEEDVLKLHETNKKYDAVMLISTIHHFSDDELKMLLPVVKKIVKKVVIIADIIPDPPHLMQKFFAKIDRGHYVRPAAEKLKILKKYFKIIKTQPIPTKSAVQFGIICEK